MKFVAITLLAFVAAAIAGPISISDNNVGDIVTVGINANAVLSSNIEQNIVTVLAALLNQQAIGVVAGSATEHQETPELHEFNVSPEMVEQLKSHITPELIEKVKSHISPALIEKVKGYLNQEQ